MGSGYFPDRHVSLFFGQNVDFQPARDCPRNFIIFDRTDNHSRIMYHPDTTTTTLVQKDEDAPGVMNEDLADIDALLSFEDDDEEEGYEEDDVSTGRTGGHDGGDTSDTCSSSMRSGGPGVLSGYELKDSERKKREKMKKMVKSLKGIVPGVNGGMNTVDVLDEAVKYLKSLKVEAQKMGVRDLQG